MSDIDWGPSDPPQEDAEPEPKAHACPDCEQSFATMGGLRMHYTKVHARKDEPDERPKRQRRERTVRVDAPPTINYGEVRDDLVANLTTVGTFTAAVFPHTGLTIVSRAPDREIPSADGEKPRKARGMASVIMDLAQKDKRVLRGVLAFNRLFVGGEAATLALSLAGAVAVDARLLDPHTAIMPGTPMEFRPVEMLIGDVVAQVDEMRGEVQEAVAPSGWEAPTEP